MDDCLKPPANEFSLGCVFDLARKVLKGDVSVDLVRQGLQQADAGLAQFGGGLTDLPAPTISVASAEDAGGDELEATCAEILSHEPKEGEVTAQLNPALIALLMQLAKLLIEKYLQKD